MRRLSGNNKAQEKEGKRLYFCQNKIMVLKVIFQCFLSTVVDNQCGGKLWELERHPEHFCLL